MLKPLRLCFLHHAIAGWQDWAPYSEIIGDRFFYLQFGDGPSAYANPHYRRLTAASSSHYRRLTANAIKLAIIR